MIHPTKSVFEPTRNILYLGFWLNSIDMTVKITKEKSLKIKNACQDLLSKELVTIQSLFEVIGLMVASFPGVQYGQLFYRQCDNLKNKKIKENNGYLGALVTLTTEVKEDLAWWVHNIENQQKNIVTPPPAIEIETDASNIGWGACVKDQKSKTTGGQWSAKELEEHINYRELLAVWLGIQCFASNLTNAHIKILSDNTTAVAYVNNQGGTKNKCNALARQIWTWCYNHKNWLTAAHIPGSKNVRADKESRVKNNNMEWELHPQNFQEICQNFGTPEIDLFASRLNHKVPKYISWRPDPNAHAVDALSVNWSNMFFYAFPPFNMIGKVLQKVELEHCTGIVVVPKWTTQTWWPKYLQLCTGKYIVLSRKKGRKMLTHPQRHQSELPKMMLVAGLLSFNNIAQQASRRK